MTTETIAPANGETRSGGDFYRARLCDLDWIRESGSGELRAAMHALCWRPRRATIDGFSTDTLVAQKVLITARGVAAELDARTDAVAAGIANRPSDDSRDLLLREQSSLQNRRAAAQSVIVACDAALQFERINASTRPKRSADELVAAIAQHRRRIHPDDASQADLDLWRVLDGAEHSAPLSLVRHA